MKARLFLHFVPLGWLLFSVLQCCPERHPTKRLRHAIVFGLHFRFFQYSPSADSRGCAETAKNLR